MTHPAPALVVTLSAMNATDARRAAAEAAAAGADLAEVRFDGWPRDALREVDQLFPAPIPLVATLRSRAEGGAGPDDPEERAALLLELAHRPFRWIDLEADRDLGLLERLPPPERTGRILSRHYPRGVGAEEWGRRVREPAPDGGVRKVVARASIRTLFDELLPRLPPAGETALLALTTGPSGPLLRAWSRRLGYPMVFAAPPESDVVSSPAPTVEPSQIPVDRLGPFLRSDTDAPLFGVAGHPVAHTRSPAIHGRWMRRDRRAGLMVALDFESETEFVDALAPLADGGFRGLSVTHPYKTAALEAATEVTGAAQACGVANCLTFRGDAVEADNTDLVAILRRLEELKRSGRWEGHSLAVVGAGGAARATLSAARALNVESYVYARRTEQGESVARTFGAHPVPLNEAHPESLVVHATNAGRDGGSVLEVPIERLLRPGSHVVDWVYSPENPLVREYAVHAGATYEDGRRLLVYQAAAAYGIWWGEEPGEEQLREALHEEGCTE